MGSTIPRLVSLDWIRKPAEAKYGRLKYYYFPALGKQRQTDLCEFEAIHIYKVPGYPGIYS